jgi:hypothetical protein
MKSIILIFSALCCTTSFSADFTSVASYQICLTSLREDANVMISEIENTGLVVYQKKSLYDRDLFLINDKKLYSCGELSVQSASSTADVLNYDIILKVDAKQFPLFVEIPTELTFGAEDVIFRESSNSNPKENLNCVEINSEKIDQAFVETVGIRLKGFPIQFKESAENKKSQEKSKIWGPDWKAKTAIDQERNGYLRVIKKCANVSALGELRTKIQNELMSIK